MQTARALRGASHGTLHGLLWSFVGIGSRGLLQLFVLSVLARVLTPEDFGVVTAALIVVGVATGVALFGIGPAIVQQQDLNVQLIRTSFTLAMGLSLVAVGLVWLTAPLFAIFFRLPDLQPVLRTMSVLFPLQALAVVSEALLLRAMRFRLLAIVDAATFAVGYGAVGIALAFMGWGFWAFVGAHLAQAAARAAVLLRLQPHPMRVMYEPTAGAKLTYFGSGHTLAGINTHLAVQGDNAVVGRWLGVEALGFYGRAYQLMAMPAMFVGEVTDRVLFPEMARVQDQPERLRVAYRRAVGLIALTVLPISVALALLAPELVSILLGPQWDPVTVPFQIFAVGMLFRTSYKISDSLARATGAVYRRAWRQALYAVLVIGGAWVGRYWGLSAVAAGVVGAIAINFILMAHLSLALTGLSWREFWEIHLPALRLAAVLGVEMWGFSLIFRAWGLPPLLIVVCVAGLSAASLAMLFRYLAQLPLGPDGDWIRTTMAAYFARG